MSVIRRISSLAEPSSEVAFSRGLIFGVSAYVLWGLLPVYWKQLAAISPLEILAHRMIWSTVFLAVLLLFQQKLLSTAQTLRDWETFRVFAVTGVLITFNWLTYIYGVTAGRVIECSLGYFLLPLVNVMLGVLVLGERLRPYQLLAVILALFGVLIQFAAYGQFPWVALVLAGTFSVYGLIRKVAAKGAIVGAFLESAIVLPLAVGLLLYLQIRDGLSFGEANSTTALLVGSGAITAVPLMLFAFAVRQLPFVLIGLLQYIAPTLQFLLGVFVYGEPFGDAKLLSFLLIWFGLLVFIGGGQSWIWKVGRPLN